jgi:hypothetical protein
VELESRILARADCPAAGSHHPNHVPVIPRDDQGFQEAVVKPRAKPGAKKREARRELYGRVVETSKRGALNENLDPKLRAYYAGIALRYDKRRSQL